VQEEEGKTVSDWSGASLRITSREDRIREINREIRELRGEG
jgi:hypothetical protein